ncbi:uncharacterized protein YukE [Actinopolyspora biskrensis]|uniref:Uncharacterized protein YukE n=1 Tax=Actinopolyspora biskrensis TaxID=1470178 RepID=A0A852YTM2_9ACTN|nr:hypothetical protein [Actinopolyspora biskrensis]NYH78534.1 uncharacterized protein YukE [Actinopolyspora biskrensis]
MSSLGETAGSLGDAASSVGDAAGSLGDAASAAGDVAGDALSSAGDVAGDVASSVTDVAGDVASSAGDALSSAGDAATDALSSVGDTVTDVASDVGGFLKDNAGHIADGAMTAINPAYGAFDALTGGLSGAQERAEQESERSDKFDKAQKSLNSGSRVPNSDQLLDDGSLGLEYYSKFLPHFKDWTGNGPDFEGEIKRRYDDLRGIDFAAFREDADRLEKVHSALLDQSSSMKRDFGGVRETWQGEASEAAAGQVNSYTSSGTVVIDEVESLAGAIAPAMDGIQKAVREYAKFVLDVGKEIKCSGKTPEETADEIRKARGDLKPEDLADVGIDDIFSGAWENLKGAAVGAVLGGPFGAVIGNTVGAKNAVDSIRQGIMDDAKKWLDSSFVPEFQKKLTQFEQQTSNTTRTVEQCYQRLLQEAEISDDPFKGVLEESGDGSGKDGRSGTSSGNGSGSGSGSGTGSAGAGAGTAGAGPPGAGGADQQPPGVPDGGEMKEDLPGPGNGESSEQNPDEVTLGEGEEKITVREPDDRGNPQVTLIGPDGEPQTYEIAFDDSAGAQQDSGPQAGEAAQPSSDGEFVAGERLTPGASDVTGAVPGAGGAATSDQPGQDGAAPGRSAAAAGTDGARQVTTVRPNEDGTAVIEQGDRTIEVERTPEGRLQLSVDDGSPQPPETRTVDFGQDSGSGDSPDSVAAGAAAERPAAPGQSAAQPGDGGTRPSSGAAQPNGDDAQRAATSVAGGAESTTGPASGAPSGAPSSAGETVGRDAYAEPASGPRDAGNPGTPPGQQGADPLDSPARTTSQWAGDNMFTGPQSDSGPRQTFTAFSGDLFSSAEDSGGSVWGDRPNNKVGEVSGSAGLPSMEDRADRTDSQGTTGLASMGDSGGSGQNDQGSGRGGMMPMGGMGGGAGQQGGDEERSNDSPWRTEGNLFDDGIDASADWKYSAVLGDPEER